MTLSPTRFTILTLSGLIPLSLYYSHLATWIADGTALYTRGKWIRRWASEQIRTGIISKTGVINHQAIERQWPGDDKFAAPKNWLDRVLV